MILKYPNLQKKSNIPICEAKGCTERAIGLVYSVWLCGKHMVEWDTKEKEKRRKEILSIFETDIK